MADDCEEVRKIIRNNHWIVLATANNRGVPQSSVVMSASDGHTIYVLTGKKTLKARNIEENENVAITIPFYKNIFHRLMRNVPPAEIHFKSKAEILPYDNQDAQELYEDTLNYNLPQDVENSSVWIKITPGHLIACYGVGVGLLKMRNPEEAFKTVKLS